MFMKRTHMPRIVFCILILIVSVAGHLCAGEVATFVDLGFSPDGKYYLFGQYGVTDKTLLPWAELFFVDVDKNNFVPGGKKQYLHTGQIVLGQDGSGALYKLLLANKDLIQKYNIDFLRQSTPLYITPDGEKQEASDPIEFRDFATGRSFKASLTQYVEGAGKNLSSSFFINLEVTDAKGNTKKYLVGTPSLKRPLIASYMIRKAMIAPQDGSLIFIIEMKRVADQGFDIRYMVEAVRIP
jgi:predicted secreted protein